MSPDPPPYIAPPELAMLLRDPAERARTAVVDVRDSDFPGAR